MAPSHSMQVIDSALAVANVAKGIFEAVPLVPSPLKGATESLIAILEIIRTMKTNKDDWATLGSHLAEQIKGIQDKVENLKSPPSTELLIVSNSYEVKLKNVLDKVRDTCRRGTFKSMVNYRIDKEEIAKLTRDMDDCYGDFMKNLAVQTHEAVHRIEGNVEQVAKNVDLQHIVHILSIQKTAQAQGSTYEKCLEGTRLPIKERIRQWADPNQSKYPIFWLCDSAGTGKSAIAVTMAEEWDLYNRLAGLFCFSNGSADTSTTALFFPTIAVDMASKIPELHSTIAEAFGSDPMLVNRGLAEQFEKLILQPLKKISREVILVMDAVDECEPGSRNKLLHLLVQQLPLIPHLKIFITSRPEHDIMPILGTSAVVQGVEFQLQSTEIVSNVNDISIYIHHHLSGVLSEDQCQLLVKRANGLFIWASTAKRELDPNNAFESTEEIFERLMSSGDSDDLGMLYHKILDRATPHPKHIDFVCQVLGVLSTIQEPISIKSLEVFIPGKPVENLMQRLRSVFNFKSREDPILFFHQTFREYLLASGQNGFAINVPNSHLLVTSKCFSLMEKELKQDILGIGYSVGRVPNNNDIPNLLARLKEHVTQPLRYSVNYWFVHVKHCIENEELMEKTLGFFRMNLLHWVEVLSLSNQMNVGIKGLHQLRSKVKTLESSASLSTQVEDWCHDALRLIQTQQTVLEVNAFAIYSIAITSAPREGILYKYYGQNSSGSTPNLLNGWRNQWPSHIVLSGHASFVNTITISNDGTRIASCSHDKTLRMWDAVTGASLGEPIPHENNVTAVAFIHNDAQIISGSVKGELAAWDVATGEAIRKIQGHTSAFTRFATSPDGMRLASASGDKALRLWSTSDFSTAPVVMEGHQTTIYSVAFSLDGMLIASCGGDRTVRLWDGMTGTSIGAPLRGHNSIVCDVALSPNGELVASVSWDTTLRLWSVKSRECVGSPFEGNFSCVSFSPDGTTIASGSSDKTIRLWNVASRECISQLRGHTDQVRCIAFLPEGNRIVSGSSDHTIRIWNLDVKQGEEETRKEHVGQVNGIAFSPCGTQIATCSADSTLKVWSVDNGDLIREMRGDAGKVNCLAFSPDGSTIALGLDNELQLWDVATKKCLKEEKSYIYCISFSHDGSRIVSGGVDVQLWDSNTGGKIKILLERRLHSIRYVSFSPDDTKIVSGSTDHSVRLWNITGEELQNHSHKSTVRFTTFSTDNLHILSSCDEEIAIWNVLSSDNIARFPHFHSSPTNLLPAYVQHLKFDITTISDGYWQSSTIFDSIQRYFSDPPVRFNEDTRTINLSNFSDYLFHLPADIHVRKWRENRGIIVFGGDDGRVMILDFSHIST